mgnify:CR=1 FL=1
MSEDKIMKKRKYLGNHDYKRNTDLFFGSGKSFSVGVFQWVERKNYGKVVHQRIEDIHEELKPSPAKVRVTGSTKNPEAVYKRCEWVCDTLDAGHTVGPKNMRVK